MNVHIDETAPISDADRRTIRDGLDAFNRRHMPAGAPEPVELALRDEAGRVCGGLLGETRWHWLEIGTLWVTEEHRGKGHGRALLHRAEEIAHERGCRMAVLDTTAFQALDFYYAQGYIPFGEVPDYPPGSRTVFLCKALVADG